MLELNRNNFLTCVVETQDHSRVKPAAWIERAQVAVNNEFHRGESKYNKPNEPTIMFLTFQT